MDHRRDSWLRFPLKHARAAKRCRSPTRKALNVRSTSLTLPKSPFFSFFFLPRSHPHFLLTVLQTNGRFIARANTQTRMLSHSPVTCNTRARNPILSQTNSCPNQQYIYNSFVFQRKSSRSIPSSFTVYASPAIHRGTFPQATATATLAPPCVPVAHHPPFSVLANRLFRFIPPAFLFSPLSPPNSKLPITRVLAHRRHGFARVAGWGGGCNNDKVFK